MPSIAKHPHVELQAALKPAFPLDARRLTVLTALVLAMIQARSVVLYTLKNYVQLPGTRAMRYQRLLRFVQFTVPEGLFTQFVLSVLPPGELWLILDRTNWKLGKQDINILLLSATWKGVSFPLLWTLLPHGGASGQQDRIALLKRFLLSCGERKVAGVMADREFLGGAWFTFLAEHSIAPCIRLRRDVRVNGIPVWACFCQLQIGELRVWHRRMNVQGVRLRVLATRNAAGEILYLAYRGWPRQNLRRYALRWQAETLHSCLKSRGFHLEDTGLTHAARVSTLLMITSLAFVWACLTGELHAASHGIKRKAHRQPAVSVFRHGLDHLQDLLLHPSTAS
ncbi:hypothetical protein HNR42_003671, partial [Deinobacterium chartae]